MMNCMNCGLPLMPGNIPSNCPRCGASLQVFQGVAPQPGAVGYPGNAPPRQPSWNPAGTPGGFSSFPQQGYTWPQQPESAPGDFGRGRRDERQPFPPRRPAPPPRSRARTIFAIAGLFVVAAGLLLGIVAFLAFSGNGGTAPTTASTTTPTPQATSTAPVASTPTVGATPVPSATPVAGGSPYPGQQYIDSAQMVTGLPGGPQQAQPATTFKVGSTMYVTFALHPPGTGGAVCSYWYLTGNSNPVVTFQQAVKAGSHNSYTYAIYGSAGQAYVELYWASDKTCADKILAQHVDFTVTA